MIERMGYIWHGWEFILLHMDFQIFLLLAHSKGSQPKCSSHKKTTPNQPSYPEKQAGLPLSDSQDAKRQVSRIHSTVSASPQGPLVGTSTGPPGTTHSCLLHCRHSLLEACIQLKDQQVSLIHDSFVSCILLLPNVDSLKNKRKQYCYQFSWLVIVIHLRSEERPGFD